MNTELGYVTAISNRHAPVEGQALSADKTMKKWVSRLKLTKDVARSRLKLTKDVARSLVPKKKS